jgi:hypothetical protein
MAKRKKTRKEIAEEARREAEAEANMRNLRELVRLGWAELVASGRPLAVDPPMSLDPPEQRRARRR